MVFQRGRAESLRSRTKPVGSGPNQQRSAALRLRHSEEVQSLRARRTACILPVCVQSSWCLDRANPATRFVCRSSIEPPTVTCDLYWNLWKEKRAFCNWCRHFHSVDKKVISNRLRLDSAAEVWGEYQKRASFFFRLFLWWRTQRRN